MYLHTFGGSALLHLLVGYPRVILLLGIAGAVALTNAPQGPGRYIGTGGHLARFDSASGTSTSTLALAAAEVRARDVAAQMMERNDTEGIAAAVDEALRQCGAGCTDLATPTVVTDPDLLRRVLVLYALDRMAAEAAADAAAARATPAMTRLGNSAQH